MPNSAQRSLVKAFEPSSCAAALLGPKALMPAAVQIVDEARDEGRFRPDHDEVDLHHPAEIDHRRMVGHVEHHIGAVLRRAGIAGGDEKLVAERARREAPGQSMLPSAGTDEKDVHGKASVMTPALLTIPAPFAYPEIAWPSSLGPARRNA